MEVTLRFLLLLKGRFYMVSFFSHVVTTGEVWLWHHCRCCTTWLKYQETLRILWQRGARAQCMQHGSVSCCDLCACSWAEAMLLSSHQLRENLKTVVISRPEQLPLWVEITQGCNTQNATLMWTIKNITPQRSGWSPLLWISEFMYFLGLSCRLVVTLSEPSPLSMGSLLAGLLPLPGVWGGLTACPTRPCSLGAGATCRVHLPFLLRPHLQVDRLVHVCELFSASHSVSLPCQCHSGRNP